LGVRTKVPAVVRHAVTGKIDSYNSKFEPSFRTAVNAGIPRREVCVDKGSSAGANYELAHELRFDLQRQIKPKLAGKVDESLQWKKAVVHFQPPGREFEAKYLIDSP
jgi:hypothetical protein